ncbi:MAG: hypothetical protein AB7W59_00055 [Acidimicrobiia bacterium]
MVIRKRDIQLTPEQEDQQQQRLGRKQASDIKRALPRKKWGAYTPAEKDQLLKALAIHFGFVDPD